MKNEEFHNRVVAEAKRMKEYMIENPDSDFNALLNESVKRLINHDDEENKDVRDRGKKMIQELLEMFLKEYESDDNLIVARIRRDDDHGNMRGVMQGDAKSLIIMVAMLIKKSQMPIDLVLEAIQELKTKPVNEDEIYEYTVPKS